MLRNFLVQTPNSLVKLHGQVRNIHHPHELEITAQASDNIIAPHDLLDCLPGLRLPDSKISRYSEIFADV